MADFKIQRGVTDFGASADTVDVGITTVDLSRAYVRLTNAVRGSSGPSAGSTLTKNTDDVSGWVTFKDATQITLHRFTSGENADYRFHWEVWEYVGPAGGPNEFKVLDALDTAITTGTSKTIAVTSPSDITKVVPILAGYSSANTTPQVSPIALTAEVLTSTNQVKFERNDSGGRATIAAFLVELTGSNWILEQNVKVAITADAGQDVAITDVLDWSHAWVEWGYRIDSTLNGLTYSTQMWWPHPSLTNKIRVGQGSTTVAFHTGSDGIGHVVRNDAIRVDHYDSVDGGEVVVPTGSSSPQALDFTITDVGPDLEAVGVAIQCNSAGTGTAYPRQFLGARLKSSTAVELWRGRHGQPLEWVLVVVRSPVTLTPDPAVFSSSAPAVALDIPRTALPTSVPVVVSAPAVALDVPRTLTPAPSSSTVSAPVVALDIPRTALPSPVPLLVSATAVTLDVPRTLTPGPAVAALEVPTVVVQLPVVLTPSPVSMVVGAPPPAVVRVLVPAPAVAVMSANRPRSIKFWVGPDPAVFAFSAADPSVEFAAVVLTPSTVVLELQAPIPLLEIPGRPMLEAQLALLEGLEVELGIAEQLEQTAALTATLELQLGIAPVLEAALAITENTQEPHP